MSMYIVMGAPGMGKSPFAQKMIAGRRCFVFDINNEYGTRTKYKGQTPINLSHDPRALRCRYIGTDINQFSQLVMQRRDTVVIFEEATAFFRGRQKGITSQIIIGRIHTGNTYVFLFHSINRVPPELMEIADIAVLFKTNDEEKTVARKYARLYNYFIDLRDKQAGDKHIIQMI